MTISRSIYIAGCLLLSVFISGCALQNKQKTMEDSTSLKKLIVKGNQGNNSSEVPTNKGNRSNRSNESDALPPSGIQQNKQHEQSKLNTDKQFPDTAKVQNYGEEKNNGTDHISPSLSERKSVKAKGIYVSGWIAGSRNKMNRLIQLVDTTDLNAMVIDIKNDSGQVTYDSKVPLVNAIGADKTKMIDDLPALVKKLRNKNIYTIGRVVVFKDPYLSASKMKWAMHRKSGALWRDNRGVAWVDPYRKEVWQYNLEIAKEAAQIGFNEIQFDYVRFPDNSAKVTREVHFHNPKQWSKAQVIQHFLKAANKHLDPTGVFLSADVFGLTTSTGDDMGIGQQWGLITQEVDFISPMVYPSHYSNGMYGIAHPDLQPYGIIRKASIDANHKNNTVSKMNKNTAVIRPWLQDFTATWVSPHQRYGNQQIISQVKAAKEQGIDQFLLWNPNCKYSYK